MTTKRLISLLLLLPLLVRGTLPGGTSAAAEIETRELNKRDPRYVYYGRVVRDGRSRICYLIGEAGLGKSRLIAEVRQEWRDQLAATFGDVNPLWRGWSEFVAVSFGASRPYDCLLYTSRCV